MIDYEKLRMAHELTRKLPGYYFDAEFGRKNHFFRLFKDANSDCIFECLYIDKLIEKLHLIIAGNNLIDVETRLLPKYQIGQNVWVVRFNNPVCSTIESNSGEEYRVAGSGRLFGEYEIYLTKGALIDAQINHWKSIRDPMSGAFVDEIYNFEKKEDSKKDITESTYAIGDNVWIIRDGIACKTFVTAVEENGTYWLNEYFGYFNNSNVFKSLLDAHQYLSSIEMKNAKEKLEAPIIWAPHQTDKKCQHESDGAFSIQTDFISINRCKKCGEVYK